MTPLSAGRAKFYMILLAVLAMLIALQGCAGTPSNAEALAAEDDHLSRWQKRNVRYQLDVVPSFAEVWFKEHLYVYTTPYFRSAALAHAGHCPGYHPVNRRSQ